MICLVGAVLSEGAWGRGARKVEEEDVRMSVRMGGHVGDRT